MTNQLDKWNRRMAKKAQDAEVIRKANTDKTETEKGADIVTKATGKTTSSEDIFMVLMRDSMEPFINLWTNSVDSKMHGVMEDIVMPTMKNEIRDMVREVVQEEVRTVIQEELQSAIRGSIRGLQEAMMPMFRNPHITSNESIFGADMDDEPEFKNGLQRLAEEKFIMATEDGAVMGNRIELGLQGVDTDGDREVMQIEPEKKPRYSKPRITTCSICGEVGHNKRGCKKQLTEV
jgi:hypothetical protein